MSQRTECDRCHTTITHGDSTQITRIDAQASTISSIYRYEDLDLCPLCTATLLRWIRALPALG